MNQGQLDINQDLVDSDILQHLDEQEIKNKWPKVLTEYVEVVINRLKADGKTDKEAKTTAYSIVIALAKHRGGKIEYLPTGRTLATAIRHKQIWDDFNGSNTEALADKYGINRISVYEIIRQQRALHTKKVQPDLF